MLHLTISQDDGVPLYLQLIQQIKRLIATGRLQPDQELPPVRVLAQQLVINPNTVVRAYRELEVAGLVYKKRGAGTYISSGGTPFTQDECQRILAQRADALLIEGWNLGYKSDQLVELIHERAEALEQQRKAGEGA